MPDHTYCQIDGKHFRLASWLSADERFVDRYLPVDPQLRFLPNRSDGLVASEATTFWASDDWSAGSGFPIWRPEAGGFDDSTAVRLHRNGQFLELAPKWLLTKDSGGSTDFVAGGIFGLGQGLVWNIASAGTNGYFWDSGNARWSAAISTGAASSAVSIADGEDTFMYSGHANGHIWRWKSGTTEDHYGTSPFTNPPLLVSFDGTLYALDGNSLYTVSKTIANTRTLVFQSSSVSTAVGFGTRRFAVSDVGPVWFVRGDDGNTYIYEYNHATSTGARIGKLPQSFITAEAIHAALGFIFVAYRTGPTGTNQGAYIHYQRGAQRGVIGPIIGNSFEDPMVICGVDGDELIFWMGNSSGELWAYNLSTGGLFRLTDFSSGSLGFAGTTVLSGIVAGPNVFIGPVTFSVAGKVARLDLSGTYQITGTFDSGKYDLAYFDIPKIITELTLQTSGVDATEGISVTIHTEGGDAGPFVATSGADVHRFVVSTATNLYYGSEISFSVTLTGDGTATPVLKKVTLRGVSGARQRELVMRIDCSDDVAGEQSSELVIQRLRALATPDVVTVIWPFEGREETAALTLAVVVHQVQLPDMLRPSDKLVATVTLRAANLVVTGA